MICWIPCHGRFVQAALLYQLIVCFTMTLMLYMSSPWHCTKAGVSLLSLRPLRMCRTLTGSA